MDKQQIFEELRELAEKIPDDSPGEILAVKGSLYAVLGSMEENKELKLAEYMLPYLYSKGVAK